MSNMQPRGDAGQRFDPEPRAPVEPPMRAGVPLRRSRTDRVFGGVCGGLGHYLNVDPVVVRIIAVALVFAGVGLVAYVIAWIVIPLTADGEPELAAPPEARHRTAAVVGAGLAGVGALLLVQNLVPMLSRVPFWPLVVLAAGIAIAVVASQPRR